MPYWRARGGNGRGHAAVCFGAVAARCPRYTATAGNGGSSDPLADRAAPGRNRAHLRSRDRNPVAHRDLARTVRPDAGRSNTFALEIVKGDGRQATADRLGITVGTARSHLSKIFDETGVTRRAELERLLLQG